MVRVGVTYQSQTFYPFPTNSYVDWMVTLYHGGTGDRNIDAFVDGTSNGACDVTSVLNGTLIQPGEYLTADWNVLDLNQQHSTPSGATAYMQIVGLTADTITEVTAVLAMAAPGPRFLNALPSLVNIPPAPTQGLVTGFNNPGLNNTVQLIAANPIYLYNVSMLSGTTAANTQGVIQASPTDTFWQWAYFNPASTTTDEPQTWDFHGMKLTLGGLWWVQIGSAAANTVAYVASAAYRAMAI